MPRDELRGCPASPARWKAAPLKSPQPGTLAPGGPGPRPVNLINRLPGPAAPPGPGGRHSRGGLSVGTGSGRAVSEVAVWCGLRRLHYQHAPFKFEYRATVTIFIVHDVNKFLFNKTQMSSR